MKKRTKDKIKGSVTVLVVIILLPMLTFSSVIVDLSRVNLAQAQISSAGELCLNTALANYDTILKDVYGLFAMSQNKTTEELKEDIKQYFIDTIVSYGVVEEVEAGDYVESLMNSVTGTVMGSMNPTDLTDFLKYDNITVEASGVEGSQLSNPDVLRNQILEYMKFRAPISLGMSFFDALSAFKTVDDQNKVLDKQVDAQQSTQKVTNACSVLIKLIREYDKCIVGELVVTSDNGTQSKELLKILGKDDPYDFLNEIELEEYPDQVLKYKSGWGGNNYEHINLMMMVFLVNSISLDSLYLSKMDYAGNVLFISEYGETINTDQCGITIDVVLGADTVTAKQEVLQQISLLDQTHKLVADKYLGVNFIDGKYLTEYLDMFTDEDAAINTFVAYEKFLNDESDVIKYSEAKLVLEELYKLEKYYTNFTNKIDADIEAEQEKMQELEEKLNADVEIKGTSKIKADDAIQNINNEITNMLNGDFLASNSAVKNAVKSAGLLDQYPTLKGDDVLRTYYETNFFNIGKTTNKYKEKVDYYLNNFKDTSTGDLGKVSEQIKKYINNKSIGWSSVENVAKKYKETGTAYAEFMRALIACSEQVSDFGTFATDYEDADARYQENLPIYNEAVQRESELRSEKNSVVDSYKACLGGFKDFSKSYQEDAYNYRRYINTATNIVDSEATAIAIQYTSMVANIEEVVRRLNEISEQIDKAIEYITTYQTKVDSWETENKNYSDTNGSDSFSDKMESDINKCKTEYNLDSFNDLKTFVESLKKEYYNFLLHLTLSEYYMYGDGKIMAMGDSETIKNALVSKKTTFPKIIDKEYAVNAFSTLYKDGYLYEYNPYTISKTKQLKFLSPNIIQIQALKYLNSAYPESHDDEPSNIEGQEGKTSDEVLEESYEGTRDNLVNQETDINKVENTAKPPAAPSSDGGKNPLNKDGYGYTFQNHSNISGEADLPSKDTKPKEGSDKQYDFEKDEDGHIETSKGKQSQTSFMDSLIGGVGDILTTGLENAYILAYLFENFSYNTIIQDAVTEHILEEEKTNIFSTRDHLTEDNINKAKDFLKTSSNYHINAENNYLFGAELEYILFGNKDLSKNITYTKAGIYAIRFGFNCIFAFTDSEIRNTTMSVGLAVQAATLGIVPYQIVQIVLQLALAAAESAIDLQVMSYGFDVAVVKSSDTWSLSLSSMAKGLVDAAANKVEEVVVKGINDITAGLQGLVDAGADNIKEAAGNLSEDLRSATQSAAEDVINKAFDKIISSVEGALNEFQNTEWGNALDSMPTEDQVRAKVNEVFSGIETKVSSELKETFSDNDLALKVLNVIEEQGVISEIIQTAKEEIDGYLEKVPDTYDPSAFIISKLTDIKIDIIGRVSSLVEDIVKSCESVVDSTVSDVQNQINETIAQYSGELTEQLTEELRGKVTGLANDYIGKYIDIGNTDAIGGGSKNSSVASIIKFGYKEYMMLFMYVDICANSDNVMKRTADVIQLNLKYADPSYSEFSHPKKTDFKMKSAYTYVSIDATAELDMFFVESNLFSDILNYNSASTTGSTPATGGNAGTAVPSVPDTPLSVIKYKGMLGY